MFTKKDFEKYVMIFSYFFIVGITYAIFHPLTDAQIKAAWGAFIVCFIVSFILKFFINNKIINTAGIIIYIISACALGGARYSEVINLEKSPQHIIHYVSENWDDKKIFEGQVVADPHIFQDRVQLEFKPDKVITEDEEIKIKYGKILLNIYPTQQLGEIFEQVATSDAYGYRLRVMGSLIYPPAEANPGGFNYRKYLRNQDFYGSMYFKFASGKNAPIEIISTEKGNLFVEWSLNLKERMVTILKQTMPYPESAFLGGVTLGLREGLKYTKCFLKNCDQLISYEFKWAGVNHVLAVSGLHVTIITIMFWSIFALIKLPKKIYAPIIIICLIIFTIITGGRPSTVRAAIMNSLVVITYVYLGSNLKTSLLFGIASAALLILLGIPVIPGNAKLVFEPAFTLSFMAVISLGLLTGPAERFMLSFKGFNFILFFIIVGTMVGLMCYDWNLFFEPYVIGPFILISLILFIVNTKLNKEYYKINKLSFLMVWEPIRTFIAAQFAIQLGMMIPLSSYYFGMYPVAGSFANFIAIPLIGFIVQIGLIAGLIGISIPFFKIGLYIALIMNAFNWILCKIFLLSAHIATKIFPYPYVKKFTILELIIYYLLLVLWIWWPDINNFLQTRLTVIRDKDVRQRIQWAGLIVLLMILVGGSFAYTNHQNKNKVFTITAMDVGWGASTLIEFPDGKNMLIDAGAVVRKYIKELKREIPNNQGERTVSQVLLKKGIKKIDVFVASSFNEQRLGGAGVMVGNFVIKKIYIPYSKKLLMRAHSAEQYYDAIMDFYKKKNADKWWVKYGYEDFRNFFDAALNSRSEIIEAEPETIILDGKYKDREYEVYILNPDTKKPFTFMSENNNSIVLKINYGDLSILYCSDINKDAIKKILKKYRSLLKSDIIFMPYYGIDKDSVNERFLRAVSPKVAIFEFKATSAINRKFKRRYKQQFNKNKQKMIKKLGKENVYSIADDNGIIITSDGSGYDIKTMIDITQARDIKAGAQEDLDVKDTQY